MQYPEAVAIALTGIVSARHGAKYASRLSGRALKRSLGVLMLLSAPAVHAKAYVLGLPPATSSKSLQNQDMIDVARRVAPASVIGIGSGFLAGLYGVGGGVIVVPALAVFTSCDHYQALATSLAAMVLPAAAGTWTHYQAGNMSLRVAPALALGACIGSYVGGKIAQQYSQESTLRWGFSGLMIVLGIRTIGKA